MPSARTISAAARASPARRMALAMRKESTRRSMARFLPKGPSADYTRLQCPALIFGPRVTFCRSCAMNKADFLKSRCLDARHALNAVMTAYHLHEWVWAGFAKRNYTLHRSWGLRRVHVDEFRRYLFGKCPALEEAEALTNWSGSMKTSSGSMGLPNPRSLLVWVVETA